MTIAHTHRHRLRALVLATTLGALALTAHRADAASPEGWHQSLKDGLEASAKSGKPLLLVTLWKEKV